MNTLRIVFHNHIQLPFSFSEMLNQFEETFAVMEMRTFKHKPFLVGGGGGYLQYFTVHEVVHANNLFSSCK